MIPLAVDAVDACGEMKMISNVGRRLPLKMEIDNRLASFEF